MTRTEMERLREKNHIPVELAEASEAPRARTVVRVTDSKGRTFAVALRRAWWKEARWFWDRVLWLHEERGLPLADAFVRAAAGYTGEERHA